MLNIFSLPNIQTHQISILKKKIIFILCNELELKKLIGLMTLCIWGLSDLNYGNHYTNSRYLVVQTIINNIT